MNKKGFTLVELLAVIVILAVVVVIAVPTINLVSKSIKDNMLEKKVTIIEESAVLYGQDRKGSIINSGEFVYNNGTKTNFNCKQIIVSTLVPNYLDKDNTNTCLTSTSTEEEGCIVDPSDTTKFLDKKIVIVYYKNNRIHASMNENFECK